MVLPTAQMLATAVAGRTFIVLHISSAMSCVHRNESSLQLCITGSLALDKVSNHSIAKCMAAASRLVEHFAHSPIAVGELKKSQLTMNPDQRVKKLIQHCKTRWNSVYDMFERLVELRWPVCAVLGVHSVIKLSKAMMSTVS